MSWSRSESRALGFLFMLALAFFIAFFDFLTFLVEEHPYFFLALIGSVTVIIYKIISVKWGRKPSAAQEAPRMKSSWSVLIGRKDIRINGIVRSISWRKKPNQPDRLYVDWDGEVVLLNVWKRPSHFHVEKGKRYLFSNISCRINKYNNKIEFHYDPEYYRSRHEEWPSRPQQTSQLTLAELLKEFGCSPSASVEEVRAKRKYWNQVLHPDFNVGKPEKLRRQMEDELKQKNELYDRIMSLMG